MSYISVIFLVIVRNTCRGERNWLVGLLTYFHMRGFFALGGSKPHSSAVDARTDEIGSSFFNLPALIIGASLGYGVMFAVRSCGRGVGKERSLSPVSCFLGVTGA